MLRGIFVGLGLLWMILLVVGKCSPEPSTMEEYSGPWMPPTAEVSRTLTIKGQASSCPIFYQKVSSRSSSTFLVYCTVDDGKSWKSYIVWPHIEDIVGPDKPQPGIELPTMN